MRFYMCCTTKERDKINSSESHLRHFLVTDTIDIKLLIFSLLKKMWRGSLPLAFEKFSHLFGNHCGSAHGYSKQLSCYVHVTR